MTGAFDPHKIKTFMGKVIQKKMKKFKSDSPLKMN